MHLSYRHSRVRQGPHVCQAWLVSHERRAGSLKMSLGWGCPSSGAVSGFGQGGSNQSERQPGSILA